MKTLLDDLYAPITSNIGYVHAPIDRTRDLLLGWRHRLGRQSVATDVTGDEFPFVFRRLEPLTMPTEPRELLVEFGDWTAYFNCRLIGADAAMAVGYLAEVTPCEALAISTVPELGRRLGSTKWELFADHQTSHINYRRVLNLVHDGKWHFLAIGEVLPFEDLERYTARRARDRFGSDLVESYSAALGLPVFDPSAYGPRMHLVESVEPGLGTAGIKTMSLAQAQTYLGIQPGRTAGLPG